MQITDQDDIGRRMRYYLSRIDLRYTLNRGKTYRDLKDFLPFFFVILSLRKMIDFMSLTKGQSEDLKALAKLMNNEPVKLNKHFDYA